VIVRSETVVAGPPEQVWAVVSDPGRLPEWWPGVKRVEEATPTAWTTVLGSPKGKVVRADYTRLEAVAEARLRWRQEVDESPFERILAEATTSLELAPAEGGTLVAIELEQRPRGWARFSPLQFRAAGKRQVQGALDGLRGLFP
jgi:uncharacterized protein YndB with AHSA1/START domain